MIIRKKIWKTFASVSLLVMASVLFGACLNNGEEYKPVFVGCFTIQKTAYSSSGIVLIQDLTGDKFYPSAKSVEDIGGLNGLERAFLEFTFQEGEKYTEGKNEYKVDLVNYGHSFGIPTKSFCVRPDTLRNDSISEFTSMWADRGYVTTQANVYVSDRVYLDMTKERIVDDTLFLHLNQNLAAQKGYKIAYAYNSFRMPSADDLRNEGIQTKEDSIVVAVSAKIARQYEKPKTEYKYCKYKLD